jgi:hypothetical protein
VSTIQTLKFQIGSKELNIDDKSIFWSNRVFDRIITNPTLIKYGTAPIQIEMFTVGVAYRVDLKDDQGNTFSISIRSFFGIGRNRKFNQFHEIADLIWDRFFEDRFSQIITDFDEGKTLHIGRFEISADGFTRKNKNDSADFQMSFDEMVLLPRYDHLLINSNVNTNKYIRIYYLEEWNWPYIQTLLQIAKEKMSEHK